MRLDKSIYHTRLASRRSCAWSDIVWRGPQVTLCGHLVGVSRAGAVRRDCCGNCEADAYTMSAGDRKRLLSRLAGLGQPGLVHVLLLRSIDD